MRRTYDWLGPTQDLTQLKNLMLQRMLLPFEYFTRSTFEDYELAMRVADNCFGNDEAGAKLDQRICELANLREIQRLRYGMYEKNVETIEEQRNASCTPSARALPAGYTNFQIVTITPFA